ncbi:hypothetical protein ACLOJK_031723 [Asimina triloba]
MSCKAISECTAGAPSSGAPSSPIEHINGRQPPADDKLRWRDSGSNGDVPSTSSIRRPAAGPQASTSSTHHEGQIWPWRHDPQHPSSPLPPSHPPALSDPSNSARPAATPLHPTPTPLSSHP